MKRFLSVALVLSLLMGMFSIHGMARTEQPSDLLETAARTMGVDVGDPYEPVETSRQQIHFNR